MKFQTWTVLVLATLLVGGCVEKSRDLTRTERQQLEQFISESATTPDHEVHIDYEGKVELIGYDLSSETWAPGSELTLTWHWKVIHGLEDGWRLFTHVSDGQAGTRVNEDGAGLVRDLYQPGLWRAGEYIRDQQTITLPADWNATQAVVYVGLWNGPHRLRIADGPSDGDNRGRVATIRVGTSAAAPAEEATPAPAVPAPPSLRASTAANIVIDGELDEASWQGAASTRAFVNTMNGSPALFRVTAKTLFDAENFYVAFMVADTDLRSDFEDQDDHLWEADCVEIMVDPDGDGRNYFELQVSPRNVSFDTRYDSRRVPQPIGHADWDSGLRSAVNLRGTLDDEDGDDGYTVEIAIPWSAFAHGEPPATPPTAGDSWRVNFYVMDSQESGQRAAGWSAPRVGDFHVPDRFGTIQFGETPRPIVPAVALPGVRERLQGRLEIGGSRVQTNDDVRRQNQPQQGETSPAE